MNSTQLFATFFLSVNFQCNSCAVCCIDSSGFRSPDLKRLVRHQGVLITLTRTVDEHEITEVPSCPFFFGFRCFCTPSYSINDPPSAPTHPYFILLRFYHPVPSFPYPYTYPATAPKTYGYQLTTSPPSIRSVLIGQLSVKDALRREQINRIVTSGVCPDGQPNGFNTRSRSLYGAARKTEALLGCEQWDPKVGIDQVLLYEGMVRPLLNLASCPLDIFSLGLFLTYHLLNPPLPT